MTLYTSTQYKEWQWIWTEVKKKKKITIIKRIDQYKERNFNHCFYLALIILPFDLNWFTFLVSLVFIELTLKQKLYYKTIANLIYLSFIENGWDKYRF